MKTTACTRRFTRRLVLVALFALTLLAAVESKSIASFHSKPRSTSSSSAARPSASTRTKIGDDQLATATIPEEVFNLVKSIVGAGVLGLPAGCAAIGGDATVIPIFLALIVGVGSLAAYGFATIGQVCAKTGAKSYREAWSKTIGPRTSSIPALACLMVTLCTVVSCSIIFSSTLPDLLKSVGVSTSPAVALWTVTVTCLLPLCLMQELKKLAPFSKVGILGTVYTAAAMGVQYILKRYREPSALLQDLPFDALPRFEPTFLVSQIPILACMMSSSFMAHYNAPKFYWQLRDHTIPRFARVVGFGYTGAVLIMSILTVFGFLTFGAGSKSLILNNYSVNDTLMTVSRFAIVISLLTGYPLAFAGVRDQCFDLLSLSQEQRKRLATPVTYGLLTIVTLVALSLKDIRLILAWGGATWGNAVIYLFPSLMLYKASKQYPELKSQVPLAVLLGFSGLALGVIGSMRALKLK